MNSQIYISKAPFAAEDFTVKDHRGTELPFKLKKVYLKHIFFLLNEMQLQYQSYSPSFPSLLALAFKYQLTLIMRNPRLGFFELFVSYRLLILNNEDVSYPLSIVSASGAEVWVSRMSAITSVSPRNLSTEIEWNRVRFSEKFGLFVWSSKSNGALWGTQEKSVSESSSLEIISQLCLSSYEDDELSFCKLENVKLVSALFAVDGNQVHFIDKYNFSDQISWPTNLLFSSGTDNSILLNTKSPVEEIENGVLFGSNSSWFHFLVEVFPRYLRFIDSDRKYFAERTLFVRGDLPKSILEIFHLIGFQRILHINDGEVRQVKNLILAKDFRYSNVTELSTRAEDLIRVRKYLLNSIAQTSGFKLVYIRRSNKLFRPLSNRKALDSLLVDLGFETVDLESKGVAEQISIFQNAQVVVCESGAALTNIIFMNPGSKVFEIHPGNDAAGLWSSLGCVFNVSVTVFYGKQNRLRNSLLGLGSYRVHINKLKNNLTKLLKN